MPAQQGAHPRENAEPGAAPGGENTPGWPRTRWNKSNSRRNRISPHRLRLLLLTTHGGQTGTIQKKFFSVVQVRQRDALRQRRENRRSAGTRRRAVPKGRGPPPAPGRAARAGAPGPPAPSPAPPSPLTSGARACGAPPAWRRAAERRGCGAASAGAAGHGRAPHLCRPLPTDRPPARAALRCAARGSAPGKRGARGRSRRCSAVCCRRPPRPAFKAARRLGRPLARSHPIPASPVPAPARSPPPLAAAARRHGAPGRGRRRRSLEEGGGGGGVTGRRTSRGCPRRSPVPPLLPATRCPQQPPRVTLSIGWRLLAALV